MWNINIDGKIVSQNDKFCKVKLFSKSDSLLDIEKRMNFVLKKVGAKYKLPETIIIFGKPNRPIEEELIKARINYYNNTYSVKFEFAG